MRMARAMVTLLGVVGTVSGWCATNVVINTNDSGAGSLREAILSANQTADVPDIIRFSIPGAGPHTISPLTPLPPITDPVVIDGYSQSGASSNTVAKGDNAILQVVVLESLVIDTTNSTVRGLVIPQIQVGAVPGPNGGNVIEGCFIGLDATGTNSLASPGFGILVQTPNNRMGGTAPGARNVISGKGATGIEIFEAFGTNNVVQGNFIGTDRTGTKAIGNTDRAVAVNSAASGNLIGGMLPGAGNVISGNLDRGITLDGSLNQVQGNWIGTTVTGLPLGNARSGVEIGGPLNGVGGSPNGAGNVIAYNGVNGGGVFNTNGVDIKAAATFFAVLGNSIFDNAGLGIDVKADNLVTPGFPLLTLVTNTSVATLIEGTFAPNTPNISFFLELFSTPIVDPSGHGEGKTLLVATLVDTDGSGHFSLTLPTPLAPGLLLTATANANTEFCEARMVTAAGGANSWTNQGNGKWENGINWSLNVPPFGGHTLVAITNGGTKTIQNDASTAAGFPTTLSVSNLVIGAPEGATNTLLLAHGGTSTPMRILNRLAVESGGALVIRDAALELEVPFNRPVSIDGALTLAGGLLAVTNSTAQLRIGDRGPGSVTVSNGTLLAYYPIVGASDGADGTWEITGGTNIIATTFDIADHLNATGTVRMTGGHLRAQDVYIGLFGDGRMVVSNGTFVCTGQGLVASQPGAQGAFTAAGGTSTFGSMLIGENDLASGTVLVTGNADVQINGPLDNRGTLTVAGGNLNVLDRFDSVGTNNALWITGGRFAATNGGSFLTRVAVSNGTYLARDVFLGNGTLGTFMVAGSGRVELPGSFNGFSAGVNGGTGIVSQVGGEVLLGNTDLNIGGLFTPAVGWWTISNGLTEAGRVLVGGQGGGNGTLRMDGGALRTSYLQVNGTSRLILNRGLLEAQSGEINTDTPFVVGDGAGSAVYELLGGTNTFGGGLRIASNARLAGTGTVMGDVTNSGTLAPGIAALAAGAAGRLRIAGSLVLSNSSELRFDLGGYAPGTDLDVLEVSGSATLGGTLAVSLSRDFQSVMTNGARFTLLTAGTPFAGGFANVASGATLTSADGYARFTVLYTSTTTLQLTDGVMVDTDNDGLPDWWEDRFGLSKTNAADAALDLDGDGAANADEFRAGTVPINSNSVFRIVAVQREAGDLRLTWTTVGGKSYRVQMNAPSGNGSFTNNFADFSPVISVGGMGESTTNYLSAEAGLTNVPARYYRVRVEP